MNFLIIVIFIGLGWSAKKCQWINDKPGSLINRYVIFICLPAIILLKIPQLKIDQSVIFPIIMAWALIPITATFIILLAKHYQWSGQIVGCLLLIVCFGNTSFVGYPIVQAFYGEQGLVYAVLYDQVGSFLSLAIIGNFILAKYSMSSSQNHETADLKPANNTTTGGFLMKVVTFPPFVALIVAFAIGDIRIPQVIQHTFWLISLTLVPATMFLVGCHFELKIPSELIKPLGWAIATKMVLAPTCALLLLWLFEQNGLNSQVTFMESAMPPMVTVSILAIHARLVPKLAIAAVGYGLITAIFVIPLVYWLSNLIR